MGKWFQSRDKMIRVEHASVTSRLLSWMLEIDEVASVVGGK